MIDLNYIVEKMNRIIPKKIIHSNDKDHFSKCEMIDKNIQCSQNTIYVEYASKLKEIKDFKNIRCLFLIEDVKADSAFFSSNNIHIAVFDGNTDKAMLIKEVQKILKNNLDFLSNSRKLTNLLFNNKSIEKIISEASNMIDNPIIILDSSYKVIAHSKNKEITDILWIDNIKRGYCTYDYIAGLNNIKEIRESPDNSKPFYVTCFTSDIRRLVSKIYLEGKFYGFLVSVESISPFNMLNHDLFEFLSNLIAVKVKMESCQNSISVNPSIIIELIQKDIINEEFLNHRIKDTIFEKVGSYKILCVDSSEYSNYHLTEDYLKNSLNRYIPFIFSVYYKKYIVMIIDNDRFNVLEKETNDKIKEFLNENSLTIGISSTFNLLIDLKKYYVQAKKAIFFSKKFGSADRWTYYEDYKFHDMIESIDDKSKLYDFCNEKVKEILKYDKENDTNYLNTLYTYINCNKSPNKSAIKLFIHKNTVIYRINKIKDIFDIDLEDYIQEFSIYYSCKILKYINKNK